MVIPLIFTAQGRQPLSTSCPRHFSRTLSTKSFTTLKLTSASSRARRTSRRPACTFSSVSCPRPLKLRKTPESLSERLSNMKTPLHRSLCGEKIGAFAPAPPLPPLTSKGRALVEVLIHRLFDAARQALRAECPRANSFLRACPQSCTGQGMEQAD